MIQHFSIVSFMCKVLIPTLARDFIQCRLFKQSRPYDKKTRQLYDKQDCITRPKWVFSREIVTKLLNHTAKLKIKKIPRLILRMDRDDKIIYNSVAPEALLNLIKTVQSPNVKCLSPKSFSLNCRSDCNTKLVELCKYFAKKPTFFDIIFLSCSVRYNHGLGS